MGDIFVHKPPGLRKSGMPDSVLMPAPVNTTTRYASSMACFSALDIFPRFDLAPPDGG